MCSSPTPTRRWARSPRSSRSALGFVFRPLGGILFGRLGDRIGRRSTLIITTLIMGVSTGLIGLLPTYAAIGVWAPILLALLRIGQGLGAGAEFGGASTLLAEHAPPGRRGYYSSFAQTGVQIGRVLGTSTFLLVTLLPLEAQQTWGWRVPFPISFAMIGVALYVRLRVAESPVFRRLERDKQVVRMPIRETLAKYPRNAVIGIGAHIADTALIYLVATFVVAYATEQLGLEDRTVLLGVVIFGLVVIAMAFGFAPMVAVRPAFYAELFGARVRYTGFASSRELGAAVAGFSPMIAAALLGAMDGEPWLIPLFTIATCAVSFVAFWLAAEGKDVDIAAVDPTQETQATQEERA
ncbi:MAG: MFS transporter [Streptosporangiales bacterium]|nr:MFS transporter [Streptosporangiales bacterium]